MQIRCVGVLCFALIFSTGNAQVPVIELMAVSPMGAKAGSEIAFNIASGTRAEEVDRLWFSHPGITAEVKTSDPLPFDSERQTAFGHFQVKVAADVPSGRYDVRAVGRHGVSNPRSFLVHQLQADAVVSASHSKLAPTKIDRNIAIHSKTTNAEVDYFLIDAKAGETLQVDVIAAQLDSRLIAQLEVIDSRGRILHSARGSDELDPQLSVQVDEDQQYTIAVYDAIFRGGSEYGYQLVVRPSDEFADLVRSHPSDQWFVRNMRDHKKLLDSATPIEETSDAKQVQVPCQITALFDSRDDVDTYQFECQANEVFFVDVVSERLGQPTDIRIVIERAEPQSEGQPKWVPVLNSDDARNSNDGVLRLNTKDPIVQFKSPKQATYRLIIRDADTGTSLGKTQRYWVDIRRPSNAFDLVAYPHYPHRDVKQFRQRGSNLFRGGCESIRVFAVRHDGWKGPIDLSVSGLPEGVTCGPATISSDRDQAQLILSANENAPHSLADLQITGTATVGDKQLKATAKLATVQWGKGGQRDLYRLRRADTLTVAVSDKDLAALTVAAGDGKVLELKRGKELKLPVRLTRRENAKNDCTVRARDLPGNVTMGDVKIAKDKSEGELVFKAKANAILGTYSCWLRAETKIKHKANPQAKVTAKAYRDKLEALSKDPANKDKLPKIQEAIKVADQRLKTAEASAKDQDLTVFVPAPQIMIRVVE